MKKLLFYYLYLLLVWGFFRLFFSFSDLTEEVLFKPIIWLAPLLAVWFSDRKKIKFFQGSIYQSIFWGGVISLLFVMSLWITRVSLPVVPGNGFWEFAGISLVTAICEELVFAGFIYLKLKQLTKKEYLSMTLTILSFVLIHIPIAIFVYKYSFFQLFLYLLLVGLVSMGSLFVMMRSKNVLGSILSHWSWSMAVFMLH